MPHNHSQPATPEPPAAESAWEASLAARPDALHALPDAPERFDIEGQLFQPGYRDPERLATWQAVRGPYWPGLRADQARSFLSVDENPPDPRRAITPNDLAAFEAQARELNIAGLGYTDLPPAAIFRGKAVLFDRVIVLSQAMDRARLDLAPSPQTLDMVMSSYYTLGRAISRLVDWLRARGYAAQAGHPLNGVTLYPWLGQRAGLGWCGLHGLLITPPCGPSHRLGVIYTNLENLPLATENDHAWIADLCARCRQCRRLCPGQAIYAAPQVHADGRRSHLDAAACFPHFARDYGCSLCIQVCPFHKHPYERIRAAFTRRQGRRSSTSARS